MATSDLLTELQKEQIRLDSDTEKRLCAVVLQKMKDTAGEISELAVKCLSALLPKVQDFNLIEIVNKLTESFLLDSKEAEGREMGNIGLKTVVTSIGPTSSGAKIVVQSLTPKLIDGMHSKDDEIIVSSLDIIRDFVVKFGSLLDVSMSETLLQLLLSLMNRNRAVIRKKTISCIGVLSVYLTMDQLDSLCKKLVLILEESAISVALLTSTVQTLAMICGAVSYRMGAHVDSSVSKIMELTTSCSDENIELIESCLKALEIFISKCPLKTKPYLDSIIELCVQFLSFDPNYSDDFDPSDQDEMQIEDEEDEVYSDEGDYSDDEDDSWKIRKASASCLSTTFIMNTDQVVHIYQKVGAVLISRFSEREENVRIDVLQAFIVLLRLLRTNISSSGESSLERSFLHLLVSILNSVFSLLDRDVSQLMKMINRQLREKSMKTRLKIFQLLKELAVVLPQQISSCVENLVNPITKALNEHSTSSSDLKIEVLSFLQISMKKSEASGYHGVLPKIAKTVFESVDQRYYKVASAALQVCIAMIHIIRPSPDSIIDDQFAGIIPELFTSIMKRLAAQDVDQEVKEYSIKAAGDSVAVLGDIEPSKVDQILQVLLERLKSETTRLTTVKALSVVAESSLELKLDGYISPAVEAFTVFLKKANMTLRQASLHALEVSCRRSGSILSSEVVQRIIMEAVLLIHDSDLHLASHSLDLLCTLSYKCPFCRPQIQSIVVPKALELVQSPLLQGTSLDSLTKFLISLLPNYFESLFKSLVVEVPGRVQQFSIARCVAALCVHSEASMQTHSIQGLIQQAQTTQNDVLKRLVLLCLGEIGRQSDLSGYPEIQVLFLKSLEDPSENIKTSASYAIGAMTLGNLPKFLPHLVNKIQTHLADAGIIYLLLQSLNEILTSLNKIKSVHSPLNQDQVLSIRGILLSSIDVKEDSRNVAAECLGQLALLHPDLILPTLRQEVTNPSENVRYIIITAIRYTVVDRPHPVDQDLKSSIPLYLESLADSSRHVRKASVQLLSSTLAHKYNLVENCLQEVLPRLYVQTKKDMDLVRVLGFGPFVHKIDDGIELRKASFECMHLLLDHAFMKLQLSEFLKHLEVGLEDLNDIKLLCYPMIIKLCHMGEAEIASHIDQLVKPLQKTLTTTIPEGSSKHEHERQQELVMSCLRVVDALSLIPGVLTQQHFKRMMDQVVNKGEMKTIFQQVQKERSEMETHQQQTSQDRPNLYSVLSQGSSGSLKF